MKPRVTATLWEDEGSLCFQVEAKGVCVARREGMRTNARLCPTLHELMFVRRQPHDQWHKAPERRWYDSRPA